MKEKLEVLIKEATLAIEKSEDLKSLDDLRVKYLGKKGEITSLKKNISKLSNEEKPMAGKLINETSKEVENKLEERKEEIKKILLDKKIKEEKIDVTANFDLYSSGHFSVINQTMAELEEIFQNMGFDVVEGPEIDTVKNVFDDLNSPKNHPSRSLSDTFYINENTLLRPHT